MAQSTENPLEFLRSARTTAAQYEETVAQLHDLENQQQTLSQELDDKQKALSSRIEETIKKRRTELETGYNKQLSQIEVRLKKTGNAREKAKNQGIRDRIASETEHLVKENKELKNQLSAVLKKDRAPAFCRTDLFYALFYPHGIKELFTLLLCFLLLFAALPAGLFYLIPEHRSWYLIPIYLVDILIFGGLYLKIYQATRVRHENAVRTGRALKDGMRSNRRKIRSIKRAIRKDESEESYNLKEFDDELAKAKQALSDVAGQKQEALNTFENVTRSIITDEIESGERAELEARKAALSDLSQSLAALQEKEKNEALALASAYGPYIGSAHLNTASIDRLTALLQSGKAKNLSDAAAQLDQPEK